MVIQKTPTKIDKIVSLKIGQRGENLATDIKMDVSDWVAIHPDAHYHCLFKRPGEVQVLPVLSSFEDGILTWTVRAWECGVIGVGYLEVRAVDSDTGMVAKSRVIPCSVEDSIIDDEGPVPPEMSWVEEVIEAKNDAEAARDEAQEVVAEAIDSIEAAGEAQVGAVNSAGATQVDAVQDKGEEVLDSIPDDYSALSGEVSSLQSAFNAIKSETEGTTIEDYNARAYQYEDVTASATKTTGHFVNNSGTLIGDSALWNYYALSAQPYDVFKVDGYQSSTVKCFYFLDANDAILAYYPTTADSSLKRYQIEAQAPVGTAKIYVNERTGAGYAPSVIYKATGAGYTHTDEYNQWKNNLNNIFADEQDYNPVSYEDITEKSNYYISGSVGGSPSENSSSLWRYMTMDVSGNDKYRVSAQYYSAIKGVYFIDANNKIVSIEGSEESDTLHTIDVTVPASAVKMAINDKKSSGFAVKKIITPINNKLIIIGDTNIEDLLSGYGNVVGTEVENNIYSVGTGEMKTIVNLHGSNNGTVRYTSLEYNGNTFKACSDDVTPVQTDIGYIGANHGYNAVYDATLASHGLTIADIGKTCTIDGETWVLLKVKSASIFTVACVADNAYGIKAVTTPPTTFNFGSSITVTSISREQLLPSVKNIAVNVTKNTSEVFEISESYDIVTLIAGISYIRNNVGGNTNDTVIEKSNPLITIRNLYSFGANGACVITQDYKALSNSVQLKYYGGTQSEKFGNSDYFAVPMTSNGTLSATGTEVNFARSTWDDQTKPPIIYCQADDSAHNSTKMMVQGILLDDRNASIYSSAGFVYTTRKMYPYAVQPNEYPAQNDVYSFVSFRLPIHAGDMNDHFKFCQYCKVGRDYYFFCFSEGSASDSIAVPSELFGKKVETVMAKNVTCKNSIIVNVIDVVATGESYLLLKLTE